MFHFPSALAAAPLSLWEQLSAWYQNSLLRELITYLTTRYFSVELGSYENFSVPANTGVLARNIVLALAAGFILALLLTAYTRVTLGGFVRTLLAEEIHSPDKAKTLYELGYFRSPSIRRELARGTILGMVVRRVGAGSPAVGDASVGEKEESVGEKTVENAHTGSKFAQKGREVIDFTTARFYIPEDLRYRADIRFDSKGSGWRPVILLTALIIVVAAALCWFLPDVLQLADNIITVFSPK